MLEWLIGAVLSAALSVPLSVITIAIADGPGHRHWAFWPVYWAWLVLLWLGVVVLEINGDDFDVW